MEKTCTVIPDTDSIHTLLSIDELKQFCEIDKVKLGAWKHEGTFKRAKFIRQKCYLEEFYNEEKYYGNINKRKFYHKLKNKTIKSFKKFRKIKITCSGMPSSCYNYVKWNKFHEGFSCGGKLIFKTIKGGVKLVETDFTIKEEKINTSIDKMTKK